MNSSKNFRMLVLGIIIGTTFSLASTAFAAGVILKAEYNSNKVIFNGEQLSLTTPLISIVDESAPQNSVNYMPVRAVLESMGYDVVWDSAANAIKITSRIDGIKEPVMIREAVDKMEAQGIKGDLAFDDNTKQLTITLTKGSSTAVISMINDGTAKTADVSFGNNKTTVNLIIKDGRSFVNESELLDALKKIGFLQ